MPKSYLTKWIDGKQVRIHRYLMEKKVGRKLLSSELVHHKDDNKFNNDIDNLEIVTRSKHKQLHPEIGEQTRFKVKYSIAKKTFIDLYVKKLLSLRKIGKLFKIPDGAMLRIKARYGITRPTIKCQLCQARASYFHPRRCSKCYQKEWHSRNH